MKRCLLAILLMSGAPLLGQSDKYDGFVMDRAAFRKIQSYCVDTHNLPADKLRMIESFVTRESRPRGLLTRLPWNRHSTCDSPGVDAWVRFEIPHDSSAAYGEHDEVSAVLLVFRPGRPSPVYETPAVGIAAVHRPDDEDRYAGKLEAKPAEYAALSGALNILIHDWHKLQAAGPR